MSDSLRPYELQHARPPYPSPAPAVYSSSCPLSRWCHPAISSSVVPRQHIKKQIHYFVDKFCLVKAMVFSSSHTWTWELDCKESWAPNNWCFWTVVLEKTLESPLDYKEIQPLHPKENQPWKFIGRTDAEAKTPTLWPTDVKKWLFCKDLISGKDWRREEKGMTEDEMVVWHQWLHGDEFE